MLMVASGFAALGYQIVWTQQASLWLGHESAGVFAVVAAFFGGIAIGALALGPRIERSASPWRWYAGCELLIAIWAIAIAVALDTVTRAMLHWIGPSPSPAWHWSVAFIGTLVLLLPATAAMGATLPAMESVLGRRHDGGRSIALLYAANTFGAVTGVLAAAFLLVPQVGLLRTAFVCAALNLLCAGLSFTLATRPPTAASAATPAARGILVTLFLTGLLGIGYEVLVVRVLTQVTENTVYTFAILLALYLVGTAAGAAIFGRWFSTRSDAGVLRDRLMLALAVTCALGTFGLAQAPAVYEATLGLLGTGMAAALGAEAAVAAAAFLLPCLVMGALFSLLAGMARQSGAGVGRALGINTLGAALAPALFGVLIAPWLSAKYALLVVAAGYLALGTRGAWARPAPWGIAAGLVVVALWGPSLVIVDVPPDGRLVRHVQGVLSTVSIVEDADGVATLHIDNRQQEGSSATLFADGRQAILPLLLHPAPAQALFLGLGTGVTSAVAAREPGVAVTAVELLPEVIDASAHFTDALDRDIPGPAPTLVHADARRFVRSSDRRFDVIVSDNFHPARSGSAALYTVEHFEAVKARLAPGGLFCQWLPLHQMDLDTLRSIVASFLAVHPRSWAMLSTNSLETPVIGLVAMRDGERVDPKRLRERLDRSGVRAGAGKLGVTDELSLLGSFFAGPEGLARFAADAPRNTDDHPVVAYRAPRITYAPDATPVERLLALIGAVRIAAQELLGGTTGREADDALPARLERYWEARNRFLAVGVGVRPTDDPQRMLEQVREPLLAVVRLSPDFRPAYDPLLRMAQALYGNDPATSRALLTALQEAAPTRPEAGAVLRQVQVRDAR
jgi:spermidine synthase